MLDFDSSLPQIVLSNQEINSFWKDIGFRDDFKEDYDFIFHDFYFCLSEDRYLKVRKGENWISIEINDFFARYQYNPINKENKKFLTYYEDEDYAFNVLRFFSKLMKYIMKKISERNILEVETEVKDKTNTKNATEIKKQKTESNIYLFKDIVKYVGSEKQGLKRKINCDCWQVHGHYRHYKSGKVVFVNPYKKGKKRNDTESKGKKYFLSE